MKQFYRILFVLALSAIVVGVLPVLAQTSVTFTVNSANDVDDGICNAAHCSLREAINASNQNYPGLYNQNNIIFNIAGTGLHTIQPATPLPTITRDVMIDATTQPGYTTGAPVIELNGSNVVAPILEDKVGIHISLSEQYPSIIRGFVINGFAYAGVMIERARYYRVQTNFIGTNAAGTEAVPNGYGVVLRNTFSTFIGGMDANQGNVISGNTADGINIQDDDSVHGSGSNRVLGNYIGLNAAGTAALGNGGNGILVDESQGTSIGEPAWAGGKNIISGNALNGIYLKNLNDEYTTIRKNFIGTDVSGTTLLGNGLNGILVDNAVQVQIGYAQRGDSANIIAGNGQNGIQYLGATSIQTDISWNSFFDNTGLAIELGSDGVTPNDNLDTDTGPSTLQNYPMLTKALASPTQGINITGTLHSQPNTPYAIDFFSSPSCDPSGYGEGKNYVASGFVTTDASGNATFLVHSNFGQTPGQYITALASKSRMSIPGYGSHDMSEFSACIQSLDAAHIGYTFTVNTTNDVNDGVCDDAHCSFREAIIQAFISIGQDNILFNIPGQGQHTISLSTESLPGLLNSVIIDGTSQPGYAGTPLIVIAGTNPAYCNLKITADFNVIRGLVMSGDCFLYVDGDDNIIQGNYFGTNAAGSAGIWVQGGGLLVEGYRNIIGGTNPVERNIVVASEGGFKVRGNHNRVQGNYVGVDVTGQIVLGNNLSGIVIEGDDNLIGGTTPGAGNIVAGGKYVGVKLPYGDGINNGILGNSIFANTLNGIDLDGHTVNSARLNDPGDVDDGPNHFQNGPLLDLAAKNGSLFSIKGTLNSTADSTFRLEFFASPACDIWGFGEGQIYLGFTNVTTGADGNVAFETELPVDVLPGYAITATATDADNNTSEFSACTTFMSADAAPILHFYRTRFVPLSWKAISWAVAYYVQVDTDPDFDNDTYPNSYFRSYTVGTTRTTLNLPNNDNFYYWQVGALHPDGSVQWSSVKSFTVDLP
jgi:trimeric autotransporter adhesin